MCIFVFENIDSERRKRKVQKKEGPHGAAARTEGTKSAELLAQAVTAYRSALEVYSAEPFPLQHEQTEKQLKECERLLIQAGSSRIDRDMPRLENQPTDRRRYASYLWLDALTSCSIT
jgi:hypothetical protein